MSKKSKDIRFMRVGGINSIKQKGYCKERSKEYFHSPPAPRGIYAFIEGFFEGFLLGGEMSKIGKQHAKFEFIKDKDGNKIFIPEDPFEEYLESLNIKSYFMDTERKKKLFDEAPDEIKRAKNKWDKKWSHHLLNSWTHYDEKEEQCYLIKPKKIRKFYHYGEIWHHLVNHVKPNEVLDRSGEYWVKTDYETFKKAFYKEFAKVKKHWIKTSDQSLGNKDFWRWASSKDHMEVFIEQVKESK